MDGTGEVKRIPVKAYAVVTNPSKKSVGQVKYPIDLESFLPYRFLTIGRRMSQTGNELSQLLQASGVSVREWRGVIVALAVYGGLTNSQLVKVSASDAPTISRAVKVLKKLGFVDTRNSKRDRRRVLVYLTQEGADFHDQIAPKRIETGELIDSCLTRKQKQTLIHLLDKIDRHLEHLKTDIQDEWAGAEN